MSLALDKNGILYLVANTWNKGKKNIDIRLVRINSDGSGGKIDLDGIIKENGHDIARAAFAKDNILYII